MLATDLAEEHLDDEERAEGAVVGGLHLVLQSVEHVIKTFTPFIDTLAQYEDRGEANDEDSHALFSPLKNSSHPGYRHLSHSLEAA